MAANDKDDHGPTGGLGFTPLAADGRLVSQCLGCARFNGGQRCDAFPDGIPEVVFDDVIIHDHPVPGDHGLRWAAPTTLEPMDTDTGE